MWHRFTENARRVILLAQQEAMRAQSSAVDTEHLLLGLFLTDEGQIGHLLERAGANASRVQVEAVSAVANYPQAEVEGEPKLTSLSKRVLELAADEAHRMRDNHIRTDHLLLALLRETRGSASQILQTQGVEWDKVRTVAMELSSSQQSATPHKKAGDEAQLLSLLERRPDLAVEVFRLDVLAIKKARLELLLRLDMYEEATVLRDEIEGEQS